MHAVVGLGNPGKEYEHTRHNLGWLVVREVARTRGFPVFAKNARYQGMLAEGEIEGAPTAFFLPITYMNNSGGAVARFMKEKGGNGALIVIHDDADLPFGDIKVSIGRGAGGHNGVRSIIDALGGNEFVRIRAGITRRGFFGGLKRPKGDELANFVLKPLSSGELKQIADIAEKADTALTHILTRGVESAMQACNGGT